MNISCNSFLHFAAAACCCMKSLYENKCCVYYKSICVSLYFVAVVHEIMA